MFEPPTHQPPHRGVDVAADRGIRAADLGELVEREPVGAFDVRTEGVRPLVVGGFGHADRDVDPRSCGQLGDREIGER